MDGERALKTVPAKHKNSQFVFVIGYITGNLGDDLLLRTVAAHHPEYTFLIVPSAGYQSYYSDFPGVQVLQVPRVARFSIRALRRLRARVSPTNLYAHKCRMVLQIGGSLYHQASYEIRIKKRYYGALSKKRPLMILGASFGPHLTEDYLAYCDGLFQRAKDVCFRDRYSYQMFQHIDHVRCAPDMIFGIGNLYPPAPRRSGECVISVIDFSRKNWLPSNVEEDSLLFLTRAIDYHLSRGIRVKLVSFCKRQGDEGGVKKVLERWQATGKAGEVQTLFYDGHNVREILDAISGAQCVISMRFHAMVLGLAYGTPVLPVVYHPKVAHVLEDLGCLEYGVQLSEMKSYSFETSRFLTLDPSKRAELREQSAETLAEMDAYLSS